MNKLLLPLFFVVFSLSLNAQVDFFIQNADSVKVGDTLEVSFLISPVDSVLGMSFSFKWDEQKLGFLEISSVNQSIPELENTEDIFGLTHINEGYFGFLWQIAAITNFSEDTEFFTAKFVGLEEGNVALEYRTDSPYGIYINLTEGEVVLNNGSVVVYNGPVGNDNLFVSQSDLSVFPNPFSEDIRVSINANQTFSAEVSITNILGVEIYNSIIDLNNGNNEFELNKNIFPVEGTYLLTIKNNEKSITKPILFR